VARIESGGPFADTIDRLVRDKHVPDQDENRLGGRQLGTRIVGRQVLFEQLFQSHPLQDMVYQGKRADLEGAERKWAIRRLLAWLQWLTAFPIALGRS
jgi:hypothetical protein